MTLAVVKKTTMRPHVMTVRCESNKRHIFNANFNAFVEKKKELDRSRWEKLKEAARVIDHIAKSDVKETFELLKSVAPKPVKSTPEEEPEVTEDNNETTST
jgi:hypothetical protein